MNYLKISKVLLMLSVLLMLCTSVFGQLSKKDYERIGQLHNEAIDSIYYGRKTPVKDVYQSVKGFLERKTNEKFDLNQKELENFINKYSDLSFEKALSQLGKDKILNTRQITELAKLKPLFRETEKFDLNKVNTALLKFESDIQKNRTLKAEEKVALLSFSTIARYSADLNYKAVNSNPNARGWKCSQDKCCKCLKNHLFGIILNDALGGIFGTLGCLAAPTPVTCILSIAGGAISSSYSYMQKKCKSECF